MDINNIKIYVVSHSEKDIKDVKFDELYTPLFVGRNGKDNFGFCSDDSGDNVSEKNPDICELTGLYWMWKNSEANILGLNHYRRYFKNDSGELLNQKDILNYLSHNDIILAKKITLVKGSVNETYAGKYILDVLNETREVVTDLFPDYLNSFDKVIKGDSFHCFNMFVANKQLIDQYCDWIFPILFELEKKIDLNIHKRVLGVIAEYIFNVWVDYNNLKIKECEVKYNGFKLNIRMFLSNISLIRAIYSEIYFKFKSD